MNRWKGWRINNLGKVHIYLFILIVFIVFISGIYIIERNLKPALISFAEPRAKIMATNAVTSALEENILYDIGYEDLYSISLDRQGRVALMQPKIGNINQISVSTAAAVQKRLEELSVEPIMVPVAQILGIEVLSGHGPRISFQVYPVGTVDVQIKDQFEDAGINQTRHKIYLNIEGQIKVVVPMAAGMSSYDMDVVLAEGIIVGDVPYFYFESQR